MAGAGWNRSVLHEIGDGDDQGPSSSGEQPHSPFAGRNRHASAPVPDSSTDSSTGSGFLGLRGTALPGRFGSGHPPGARPPRRLGGGARLAGLAGLVGTPVSTRLLVEATRQVQQPVSTGRRIAVMGVGGGSGTTTLACLLATVFATRRADAVLAVDTAASGGALAWRLGLRPGIDAEALAGRLGAALPSGLAELDRLLPSTASGVRVLPASTTSEGEPEITHTAGAVGTAALMRHVSRHFAVTLLDGPPAARSGAAGLTGAATSAGTATSAELPPAHATVLVAPASSRGLRRVLGLLSRSAPDDGGPALSGKVRERSVVALVGLDRESVDARRALRALTDYGVPAFHLPHDPHLAAGTPLDPALVRPRTVLAATQVAGAVLTLALATSPAAAGPGAI